MPMLEISREGGKLLKGLLDSTEGNGVFVSISGIDRGEFRDVFESWTYQTFVRFIPGLALCFNGALAAIYLALHLKKIADRTAPSQNSAVFSSSASHSGPNPSFPRRIRSMLSMCGVLQLALLVEALSTQALGIVVLIGGWLSTPNLRYMFLSTVHASKTMSHNDCVRIIVFIQFFFMGLLPKSLEWMVILFHGFSGIVLATKPRHSEQHQTIESISFSSTLMHHLHICTVVCAFNTRYISGHPL